MHSKNSRRKSRVPYKPGLHEFVKARNRFSRHPGSDPPWHQRGYLPHRDELGLTQFVTFRLVDSFPRNLQAQWKALLQIEEHEERQEKLEEFLDKGHGSCWLKIKPVAELVESSLLYHHRSHYDLLAWAIMSNHVHVVFTPLSRSMGNIVRVWKSYTARVANSILNRSGSFWSADYWDTYMRDDEHLLKTIHYTEANPVSAYLVQEKSQWPWSSAKFRDRFGKLHIPAPNR